MAKGRVAISPESCKSCSYCVMSCPKKVLAIGDEVNSKGYPFVVAKNPDDCIGCAMCGNICPESAIEVWRG